MSSQIRRSGNAPDHQSASAPSASSSGQPANPASAAKARIPSAKLNALSAFSKKTSGPTAAPASGRAMETTPTKWNGVVIKTRPGDSKAFPGQVHAALDQIASKPVGKQLLDEIGTHQGNDKFGYTVAILPQASEKRQTWFGRPRTYADGNVTKADNDVNASTPGKGAASSIKWNPQQTVTPDGKRPPFIGLAHEMIHARHNLKGESHLIPEKSSGSSGGMVAEGSSGIAQQNRPGSVANPKIRDENKVVGLGEYADSSQHPLTENNIRLEHGLEQRENYSGLVE